MNTVPFHSANLPRRSKVKLTDGQCYTCPEGRRVEVWRIKDEDGLCLRFYNRTTDGQISELVFGLHRPAAEALLHGLNTLLEESVEHMAERTVRVAGDAECELCHKLYRDHEMFTGHLTDDGTGRQVPWLRIGCHGELLKL